MDTAAASWEEDLERWLEPFRALLNRPAQKRQMAAYLKGLVLPGERKSLEPMAARVAPGDLQQLHHFVSTSSWPAWPLEDELIRQADALLGGPEALLVIDDTALVKQGKRSVGVARQYCGQLGKTASCQVLVSLTLARDEVPLPLALRLFLPDAWVDDPARCDEVGVPASRRRHLPKTELALEELDRLLELGVRFGHVAVDAGYGISAGFRHGLSARPVLDRGDPEEARRLPGRGGVGVARADRRSSPPASGAGDTRGRGRDDAGRRRLAADLLASRHQGLAAGRVRRAAGAAGRRRRRPRWPPSARRRGVAGRRAPRQR